MVVEYQGMNIEIKGTSKKEYYVDGCSVPFSTLRKAKIYIDSLVAKRSKLANKREIDKNVKKYLDEQESLKNSLNEPTP